MAPSRNKISDAIENAQVIDLVSSDDEKNGDFSLATVASGKRRRRDADATTTVPGATRAAKKTLHTTTDSSNHANCMPFITGSPPDDAVCTCNLMPLLHQWTSSDILCCSGRTRSTPTTSALLHIRQTDKWSCGFRSTQVMLTAILPLLPQHHLLYSHYSLQKEYPPSHQHRPVPIPSLYDLQVFLEHSWKAGFDARGAKHYQHKIVGQSKEIGAVEVSTIFSFLHLDSSVVQFIQIPTSRSMLGPFVWHYFGKGPCWTCCGNDAAVGATSCTDWALALLQAVSCKHASRDNQHDNDNNTCSCPIIPLYLQWQGHAVCIVGIEKKQDDFDLLVFDPMKRGQDLRESLDSKAKDVLKPMRMSCTKFAKRDVQILMCSPRELSLAKRSALQSGGGGGNVVTAAATAVVQYRQQQQQQQQR